MSSAGFANIILIVFILVILFSGLSISKNQRRAAGNDTFQVSGIPGTTGSTDCSKLTASARALLGECQEQICINTSCMSKSDLLNVTRINSTNTQLLAQAQVAQTQAAQAQAQLNMVQTQAQVAQGQTSQVQTQVMVAQTQITQLTDKVAKM